MDEQAQTLFLTLFPLFFIALWMGVTTLLGMLSGWFTLQRLFPTVGEPALLTLRMRSGRMGRGVNMNGILTLSACPSGLRIGMLRLFGPFQRPFTVPWRQIEVEPRTIFFVPSARLSLGRPETGSLTIDARLWQRLAAHAPMAMPAPELPPVSVKRSGQAMLLLWIAATAFAAIFFFFASRAGGGTGLPLAACIALPGALFGIATLTRFLRQVGDWR